jgi:hypothetical protein
MAAGAHANGQRLPSAGTAVPAQVALDRAGHLRREQIRGAGSGTTALPAGLCPSVPVPAGWAALRRDGGRGGRHPRVRGWLGGVPWRGGHKCRIQA